MKVKKAEEKRNQKSRAEKKQTRGDNDCVARTRSKKVTCSLGLQAPCGKLMTYESSDQVDVEAVDTMKSEQETEQVVADQNNDRIPQKVSGRDRHRQRRHVR